MPEMDNFFKRIWEDQEKTRVQKQEWDDYIDKLIEEAMGCENSEENEKLITA